jgi:type II secretory pathway component GspD/PulD (secretin)
MELRQQVQVMSGGRTHFESGEVVEIPLIVREPQTGRDLVTQIDRRTVGLQVDLDAVHVDGRWVLTVDFQDSTFSGGREVRTAMQSQKMVKLGSPVTLLASFTRTTAATTATRVPVLGSIPKIGRSLFRKSTTQRGNRAVMILARPVMVTTP